MTKTAKDLLEWMLIEIEEFDQECKEQEYTDTDHVWQLLNGFRNQIEAVKADTEPAPLNLYLMVKAEFDDAAAWDSCVMVAATEEEAIELSGFEPEEFDHVTQVGVQQTKQEQGILLSQKD